MAWSRRKPRDAVGSRLRRIMLERGLTDQFLRGMLARAGFTCSQPYLNRLKNGHELAFPWTIDYLATALNLDGPTRLEWHKAAAADYGYDMGVIG